ncbi:MAG TPA: hypothetical protein VFQ80_16135, partial [Thermomicrobiales bacterium]|nr:hypothetical protein [Thermomicrobiales bacterium]
DIGWARPAADAVVGSRRLAAGDWDALDAGQSFAAELRNAGDTPLTLVLLSIAPVAAPAATPPATTQVEPLLAARFDSIAADANWIGVERYTAPPGAAWKQGAADANGVGPMLYRIERGGVSVQADGAIEVTRAGAPQPTTIAAGATIALAAGDVAYMPSGLVSRWRNDGTAPAVVFDSGITTVGLADLSMFKSYAMPINDWGVAPPPAPLAFAVERVTIAAGGVLRGGPALGKKLLAVESGTADIVWATPLASDLQQPAAPAASVPPKQLTANHWLDINQPRQYAAELRNSGSEPLVVLVLTAAPAATAPGAAS